PSTLKKRQPNVPSNIFMQDRCVEEVNGQVLLPAGIDVAESAPVATQIPPSGVDRASAHPALFKNLSFHDSAKLGCTERLHEVLGAQDQTLCRSHRTFGESLKDRSEPRVQSKIPQEPFP